MIMDCRFFYTSLRHTVGRGQPHLPPKHRIAIDQTKSVSSFSIAILQKDRSGHQLSSSTVHYIEYKPVNRIQKKKRGTDLLPLIK